MALIHRCDRCKNDFTNSEDLAPVDIGRDRDNSYQQMDLNRHDIPKLPVHRDLCRSCIIVLLVALKPEVKEQKELKA